jgi:hypothetical protein
VRRLKALWHGAGTDTLVFVPALPDSNDESELF